MCSPRLRPYRAHWQSRRHRHQAAANLKLTAIARTGANRATFHPPANPRSIPPLRELQLPAVLPAQALAARLSVRQSLRSRPVRQALAQVRRLSAREAKIVARRRERLAPLDEMPGAALGEAPMAGEQTTELACAAKWGQNRLSGVVRGGCRQFWTQRAASPR